MKTQTVTHKKGILAINIATSGLPLHLPLGKNEDSATTVETKGTFFSLGKRQQEMLFCARWVYSTEPWKGVFQNQTTCGWVVEPTTSNTVDDRRAMWWSKVHLKLGRDAWGRALASVACKANFSSNDAYSNIHKTAFGFRRKRKINVGGSDRFKMWPRQSIMVKSSHPIGSCAVRAEKGVWQMKLILFTTGEAALH